MGKSRVRLFVIVLLLLLLLIFILHIIASVLYDGPISLTFMPDDTTSDIESFINQKLPFLNAHLEYIGYSTHDIDSPDTPIFFSWYTSSLPGFLSLGTDAYILCLVHFDLDEGGFDSVNAYIGSSKAIDSVTGRYSYSFHRTD